MKKVVNQHTRNNFQTVVAKTHTPPTQTVKQSLKRDIPKISPAVPSQHLIEKIRSFMQPDSHYYLGFGGLGDALLLLATCWDDPKARVVFFANYIPFVQQFFELFGIPVYLEKNIMGTPTASQIFDIMTHHRNFRQSAHLADGLYYGDWVHEDKYIPRIKPYVPWTEKLGVIKSNKPIVVICPSGSHKDVNRQRYITPEEYKMLVDKYLDSGYQVFASGSVSDLHYYSLIRRENSHWLTAEDIHNWNGTTDKIELKKMLQIINGAEKVISSDTWMKTYSLLCNIDTTVIQTRWNGQYHNYGDDVTDWIFLNKRIWPNLKIEPIINLLLSSNPSVLPPTRNLLF